MFLNTKIALDTYHISPSTGFLPEVCPANYPLNVYYRAWEKVAGDIPQLLENGTLRHVVSSLPVLSTFKLHSELEWRKAYVVLAFMAQAYIWGGKKPNSVRLSDSLHPYLF